jgi:hypothetical protein
LIVIASDSSPSSSDDEHESSNEFFNEDEEDLNKLRMRLQQHKVQSPTIPNKTMVNANTVIISPPNSLIAGRVINFGSGFKIPKRPRFHPLFKFQFLAYSQNGYLADLYTIHNFKFNSKNKRPPIVSVIFLATIQHLQTCHQRRNISNC